VALALTLLVAAVGCGEPAPVGGGTGADTSPFGPGLFDSGSVKFDTGSPVPSDTGQPIADTTDASDPLVDAGAEDATAPGDAMVEQDVVAEPDEASEDTSTGSCQGKVGCACLSDADCDSGKCTWLPDGNRECAEVCTDACPAATVCVEPSSDATTKYCLPKKLTLCDPCTVNSDCTHPGDPYAACVAWGPGKGSFCGTWCSKSTPCPAGYTCQQTDDVDGNGVVQCVPDAGAMCTCSGRAMTLKLATSCGSGPCAGQRVCLADGEPGAPAGGGLTDCSGAAPIAEACDGVDNDCDGQTDEAACDDGQPCTKDSCEPATGCVNAPMVAQPCDDGDACTSGETCDDQGVCAGLPKDCDDKQACTKNTCDPKTGGCAFPPLGDGDACDDGDGCSVGETCTGGKCAGGVAKDCADKNPCTADACDKAAGQCSNKPVADGGACEDGDLCTENDTCTAGQCSAGKAKDCGGGNPCVNASCDGATGQCANKILGDGSACDDGNKCTVKTTCTKGVCGGGDVAQCDDGNTCTIDSCDKAQGCKITPKKAGAKCDDGNACTTGDACAYVQAGVKCQGAGNPCDDGKPCTLDICNPKTAKCSHTQAKPGAKCNDGSLCTYSDVCVSAGGKLSCVGKVVPCSDGKVCTLDGCDKQTGQCKFTPVKPGGACDDGNKCTVLDKCKLVGGKTVCKGSIKTCIDANDCTADSCDSKTGACKNVPIVGCNSDLCKSGADCNDGDACTKDVCSSGKCKWLPVAGCCELYDVSYGNEKDKPIYSTSGEYLFDVALSATDGGSFAAGYVHAGTNKGSYQGLVIRRAANGKKVWAKHVGPTTGSLSDYFRGVVPRSDGGTWAAGFTYGHGSKGSADGWVVRLSALGSVISSEVFGGSGSDIFYGATARGKDGLIAVGRRYIGGAAGYDAWVVWLDANGKKTGLKERFFGGSSTQNAMAVAWHAKTGRTLVAGSGSVAGKGYQGWLWSISPVGSVTSKHFGGSKSEYLYGITVLADGNVAAAGVTYSGKNPDGFVVRASATLGGAKQYNIVGAKNDYLYDIDQSPDGKVVAAGYSNSGGAGGYDGWAVTLDPVKTTQVANHRFGSDKNDYLYALAVDKGGKRLMAGRTYAGANGDTWQLKADASGKASCGSSGCKSSKECGDGNPCTLDICKSGKCSHLLMNGLSCGGGKVCQSGKCVCTTWNVTYGNEKDNPKYKTTSEYLHAITRAKKGGGSIAAGYVNDGSKNGGMQGLVVRRDDAGKLVWAKHFGTLKTSKSDYLRGVVARSDGGAWAAGYTYNPAVGTSPDGWLLRVTASGGLIKEVRIGGSTSEVIYSAARWGTDGVVLAGYRNVPGGSGNEAWLVWRDANGNPSGLKEKTFGGSGSQYLWGVAWDSVSGATIAVGYQYQSGVSNQGLMARVSKTGSVKSLLTGGSGAELLYDVEILSGSQVWAAGYTTTSASGGRDGWLVRTTTSLSKPIGYKVGGSKYDTIYDLTTTTKGRLVAAGYSNSGPSANYDGWLAEVDPKTGKALWNRYLGGSKSDYFYGVARNASGGYVACGRAYSYPPTTTDADTWQVSVASDGNLVCK